MFAGFAVLQEWSALPPVDSSRQATPWLFVSPAPQRHDAAHILTAHLSMTPQQLMLSAAAAVQQQQQWSPAQQRQHRQPTAYACLLQQLDAAAAEQIDVTLSQLGQMSEMAVARALSVQFPAGFGLFLGNSMPIRDMDMYAGARQAAAAAVAAAQVPVVTLSSAVAAAVVAAAAAGGGDAASRSESSSFDSFSQQGISSQVLSAEEARHSSSGSADSIGSMPPGGLLAWRGSSSSSSSGSSQPPDPSTAAYSSTSSLPDALVGVPVAANRGASGIDGVLSSAAGFAAGLQRPVTLVIGDLSFLHDVNGLSLLRGGEMAPPLTVVLINNKGGGIFSFLPVADAVGRAAFERLWGTPQNVDLEGKP
jgi:isochorismate synthase/2-succinyl-5-enolpyruvyl-6-hydroxy-3-cyclohexene-1-carboxylate synthase/2-succinyl-6-hydroxy-2,4-cyclohexadiene-1-carboxylate synthase/O-succinylbenzoate synthase